MSKRFQLFLALLLVLSLTLGACSSPAPAEPVTEATEAVVEEAVAEVPAEQEAVDLNSMFSSMLDTMKGYNAVKADDLLAEMAEDNPPFLLDVREVSELEEKGHIEGAINIPLREVADHIELLPSFDTTIVSYCGSGWRCTIAMTALEAMGWENVLSLKEGSFGGWLEAGYPVAEGAALEAEVLDVADPDPALVLSMQAMLQNVPEGFGGISIDDLNTELAENPQFTV